jgi:hypothetical protein
MPAQVPLVSGRNRVWTAGFNLAAVRLLRIDEQATPGRREEAHPSGVEVDHRAHGCSLKHEDEVGGEVRVVGPGKAQPVQHWHERREVRVDGLAPDGRRQTRLLTAVLRKDAAARRACESACASGRPVSCARSSSWAEVRTSVASVCMDP